MHNIQTIRRHAPSSFHKFSSARHLLGSFLHYNHLVHVFVFVLARVDRLGHHPEVVPAVPKLRRQIVELVEGNAAVRVQEAGLLEEMHVRAVALVVRDEGPGPDIINNTTSYSFF